MREWIDSLFVGQHVGDFHLQQAGACRVGDVDDRIFRREVVADSARGCTRKFRLAAPLRRVLTVARFRGCPPARPGIPPLSSRLPSRGASPAAKPPLLLSCSMKNIGRFRRYSAGERPAPRPRSRKSRAQGTGQVGKQAGPVGAGHDHGHCAAIGEIPGATVSSCLSTRLALPCQVHLGRTPSSRRVSISSMIRRHACQSGPISALRRRSRARFQLACTAGFVSAPPRSAAAVLLVQSASN